MKKGRVGSTTKRNVLVRCGTRRLSDKSLKTSLLHPWPCAISAQEIVAVRARLGKRVQGSTF
eukprot:900657-Pelagomonas_calceolata.AAC.3